MNHYKKNTGHIQCICSLSHVQRSVSTGDKTQWIYYDSLVILVIRKSVKGVNEKQAESVGEGLRRESERGWCSSPWSGPSPGKANGYPRKRSSETGPSESRVPRTPAEAARSPAGPAFVAFHLPRIVSTSLPQSWSSGERRGELRRRVGAAGVHVPQIFHPPTS